MSKRGAVTTLAMAAMTAAGLGSCDSAETHEVFTVDDAVDEVVVLTDAGHLELVGGDTVRIDRVSRGWKGSLSLSTRVEDGVLFLTARCKRVFGCNVNTRLTLPPDLSVTAEVGDGSITAVGLDGVLDLTVGTGFVSGEALRSPELLVLVGSGHVSLALDEAEDVHVLVASGDADVDLPAGAYDLALDAGGGILDVSGVQDGGDAPLEVMAAAGLVSVTGR